MEVLLLYPIPFSIVYLLSHLDKQYRTTDAQHDHTNTQTDTQYPTNTVHTQHVEHHTNAPEHAHTRLR